MAGQVWVPGQREGPGSRRLSLLSYNIHIASRPGRYGHYLTRAWRHALPGPGMHETLDNMADVMRAFDFVAVQEADAGSLRSRFVNQLEYLARRGGFSHVGHVVTRDLRPFARHALGFLSRLEPVQIDTHVLPARLPGRRALRVELGAEVGGLNLLIAHLSLGSKDQHRQLDYLAKLVARETPTVLMGDLNCSADELRRHGGLVRGGLWLPHAAPSTYPSWQPRRDLDHILVTPGVTVHRVEGLPHLYSDHLPLGAEISVAGNT